MEKTIQLYKSQYGFQTKRRCEQAIMDLIGKILHELHNKKVTLALFIDLSKAFEYIKPWYINKKTRNI